jgi:hypothetical protein
MWSESANKTDSIHPFNVALEKDVATKGCFEDDFSFFCNQYNILRCPNISSTLEEEVRVSDVSIDISNWRALLLSVCCVGAKVRQLRFHNCCLSSQHLKDLAMALSRAAIVKILRLQYCIFRFDEPNETDYIEGFKGLLNDSNQVEYLSLQGCCIPDTVATEFIPALQSNYKLLSLNLSGNMLGDTTLEALSQAVRLVGSYRAFSFAGNPISVVGIKSILKLFLGTQSLPKDEGDMKAITKLVSDKNKGLKDTNKKRKKAGFTEIPDYSPMPECIRVVEGKPCICNYHISTIDFGSVELSQQDVDDLALYLENFQAVNLHDLPIKVYFSSTLPVTESSSKTFGKYPNNFVFV